MKPLDDLIKGFLGEVLISCADVVLFSLGLASLLLYWVAPPLLTTEASEATGVKPATVPMVLVPLEVVVAVTVTVVLSVVASRRVRKSSLWMNFELTRDISRDFGASLCRCDRRSILTAGISKSS